MSSQALRAEKAHTPWTMNGNDDEWRCPENENASVSGSATIYDAHGTVVAFAVSTGWNDHDANRRDLIIRAVNCHDELVAAVKDARSMLRMVEVVDGEDGDPWSNALARMEAAIAKAMGASK